MYHDCIPPRRPPGLAGLFLCLRCALVDQGKPERVTVFIDYENVSRSARRCFLPNDSPAHAGQFDPLELSRILVSRRPRPSVLGEVRVYRGRPSPDRQPQAAAANDRQLSRWTRDSLVTAIRRPLSYRTDGKTGKLVISEKGIDVALAVDMVRLAISGGYDTAILVSRDTDQIPALETVRDLGATWVEVAAWRGDSRLRFADGKGPWCHWLNSQDYELVADNRDYTRP